MSIIRDEIENSRTLQTDASLLNRIKNVDGAGSGLDAEFVGGVNKNQCTAWVNFDGTDGTIRDSFNVASVVRNDTGDYTITFDVEMDNTDYSVISGTITKDAANWFDRGLGENTENRTTSSMNIYTGYGTDTSEDWDTVNIQVSGGKN